MKWRRPSVEPPLVPPVAALSLKRAQHSHALRAADKRIDVIEQFNEKLIIKQEDSPLAIIDLLTGSVVKVRPAAVAAHARTRPTCNPHFGPPNTSRSVVLATPSTALAIAPAAGVQPEVPYPIRFHIPLRVQHLPRF